MKAVRFDKYGDRSVLYIAEVDEPTPTEGRVVVKVRAAGINPGEAAIRGGAMEARFPSTFPSGEGSDFAGVISAVGPDVEDFIVGDGVLGWSFERSSHAEYVSVPADQLIHKPAALGWLEAGGLYVVGVTAFAAVDAINVQEGDIVAVSAAAGGVGTLVVQLLLLRGATVLAIASESNHQWLEAKGAIPVAYGENLKADLQAAAPTKIDAFIDLFGPEYIDLALDLGVAPERIETIISFARAAEVGAQTKGSGDATNTEVLAYMADLVASGQIEFPIAATFPLEQVSNAFELLEQGHTHGKVVLVVHDPELPSAA
jgi:NADPH:quinone reductase-like Zn-dependent oxidoreductase